MEGAIRGTQHTKTKPETQEKLQVLEKTIEASGDNEHTMEYKQRRRATSKTHNKQQILGTPKESANKNWTDMEDKRITTLEEVEVARKSLQLMKTDMQQHVVVLIEL